MSQEREAKDLEMPCSYFPLFRHVTWPSFHNLFLKLVVFSQNMFCTSGWVHLGHGLTKLMRNLLQRRVASIRCLDFFKWRHLLTTLLFCASFLPPLCLWPALSQLSFLHATNGGEGGGGWSLRVSESLLRFELDLGLTEEKNHTPIFL